MNHAHRRKSFWKRLVLLILIIAGVVFISFYTNRWWGPEPERKGYDEQLVIQPEMTIGEFGRKNEIPQELLVEIFEITQLSDTLKALDRSGFSVDQILVKTRTGLTEYSEENSKNPLRFTVHFIFYLLFLSMVFVLMRKMRISPKTRILLYVAGIVVFGFGFNSNPSPMGPMRDTIALFGNPVEIVHPRLFAILTFLVFVVLANKFICGWACQFGVLQDLIFRLNRNSADTKGLIRQYKIPFRISNSIRISFFVLASSASFLWAFNLIEAIDPFNIFNPENASIAGGIFMGILIMLSLFVYRPWCHLFCPFGLLGWLFEKISVYKINVSFDACTLCGKCAASCPSDAMKAIFENKNTKPDCFACGTCLNVCPEDAIRFDYIPTRKKSKS